MYSSPSGSMRKNGPRPKRSFAGTGRSSKTFMLTAENLTYHLVRGIPGCGRRRWSHRRRTVVIAMWRSRDRVIEGTRRLSFDTDVLSLLPRDSRVIQAFRAFCPVRNTRSAVCVLYCSRRARDFRIRRRDRRVDRKAFARRRRFSAWMPAPPIERASFAWLADRQLLILHDHYLDEALQRLSPDHLSSVDRRDAAICSRCHPPMRSARAAGPGRRCSSCCETPSAAENRAA